MARGRVRRGKGVAIKPRIDARSSNLVYHLEIAHVDVHVGFNGQLARGAHDGEPRGHRACAARTDQSASVEDQDAAARLVKGQLHGRKAPRRVVGI